MNLKYTIGRKDMTFPAFFCLLISLAFFSCDNKQFVRNTEARDNPIEMQNAETAQAKLSDSVQATLETEPVKVLDASEDAADDPAIWYNISAPEKSIVFGSNKKNGIHVYDLSGKELQYVACGRVNNIDVRRKVKFSDGVADILAGSCRTDNSIVLFVIDKDGKINSEPDYKISLGAFNPYGFCLYKGKDNVLYNFVNSKDGQVSQISVDLADGQLVSESVRNLKLATQVEGMVVDDATHTLYVGEEQTGIHVFSAEPNASTKGYLLNSSTDANKKIRYDIEGLALIPPNHLIASSQGNFSYAIFDLKKKKYINSFFIKDGIVDGAEETDGLEVMKGDFNDQFPAGILVVQDGFNYNDEKAPEAQNFKYVDLREVMKFIE